MSYSIELIDPVSKETLHVEAKHFMQGGVFVSGGTTEMYLNVTYNYSKRLYEVMGEKGIRGIYGLTALESIPILGNAIEKLGDDVSDDYWEPTDGNIKRALINLKTMAQMRPDGIWDGD